MGGAKLGSRIIVHSHIDSRTPVIEKVPDSGRVTGNTECMVRRLVASEK
jgi:hypothetical protein